MLCLKLTLELNLHCKIVTVWELGPAMVLKDRSQERKLGLVREDTEVQEGQARNFICH